MPVIDLKAFVPTKDLAMSRQFYTDLGFKQNWANDQIAEFQVGSFRFLLQPFYVQQHAENFMMQPAAAVARRPGAGRQSLRLGAARPRAIYLGTLRCNVPC
jgi:catechol 2,3-dioxygenase-like lactoylglutathione lyase family enzyme